MPATAQRNHLSPTHGYPGSDMTALVCCGMLMFWHMIVSKAVRLFSQGSVTAGLNIL